MVEKQYLTRIIESNYQNNFLQSDINISVIIVENMKSFADSKIVYVNRAFTRMTGYDLSDIADAKYIDIIYKIDRKTTIENYMSQINKNNYYNLEYRIIKKDGSLIWVMDHGLLILDKDNKKKMQSVLVNINIMKEQQENIRLSEERFRIATRVSNAVIFEVDLLKQEYTYFENAEKIFGVSGEQILRETKEFSKLSSEEYMKAASDYFCYPEDNPVVEKAFGDIMSGKHTYYEARMKAGKSNYIWCRLSLAPICSSDGTPIRMIGHIVGIDKMKRKEKLLEHQIKLDPFTKLYNKDYIAGIIDKTIKNNIDKKYACIIVDIDNFKKINDNYGHDVGDKVLKKVSKKMIEIFKNNHIIGRIGGDEFLVFVELVSNVQAIIIKLERFKEKIFYNFKGKKKFVKIFVSIGIAVYPNNGNSYEDLFKSADIALYSSKHAGKNCIMLYDKEKT